MRAQTLPAAAGWRWLIGGYALFRRNPLLLSLLVIAYWLTVAMLNVLPIIGALVASLAMPGLTVGMMRACQGIERGTPVGVPTLYGSLRDNAKSLMTLGALYLCATLGILGVSALADGGEFFRAMTGAGPVDKDALDDGGFLLPALVVMTLLVPLLMAYWFAPILAAWHRLPAGKALFFSFVACWLNWRAFLAYGLALFGVAGVIPGVVLAAIGLISPEAASFLTAAFTVPMVLVVAPIVFASFYVSYREVFGFSDLA